MVQYNLDENIRTLLYKKNILNRLVPLVYIFQVYSLSLSDILSLSAKI
jgi:hypothetical protein